MKVKVVTNSSVKENRGKFSQISAKKKKGKGEKRKKVSSREGE